MPNPIKPLGALVEEWRKDGPHFKLFTEDYAIGKHSGRLQSADELDAWLEQVKASIEQLEMGIGDSNSLLAVVTKAKCAELRRLLGVK